MNIFVELKQHLMPQILNISRENILSAIEKIENDPSIVKGRTSSTYDLMHEGKTYPPILVISIANQILGGQEITLEDFNNNVNIPFNILKKLEFHIVKKEISYYEELNRFIEQSQTSDLKYSEYLKKYLDLNVKVSFGQGGVANIPWISFLREGITTSNGIYPVYLYFKKENLLILAYGVSETNQPIYNWPKNDLITIENYFQQNNLKIPFRYGKSFVFKTYNAEKLPDKKTINEDLSKLLNYYKSIELNMKIEGAIKNNIEFDLSSFSDKLRSTNLQFDSKIVHRFIASIASKPFVIISGLSGSGKTRIAQSFVQWISENETQYKIIPVGADWTNREPLLGYPNGLDSTTYITPDSGALQLIYEASRVENEYKPYFMVLDEMNLSHVERYFADFLSIMESNDSIKLYSGQKRKDSKGNEIGNEIYWPKNLFIIGTVNIDETTYMFSPKVLDRANVIEFRITESEIGTFLEKPSKPELDNLKWQGAAMADSFLTIANSNNLENNETIKSELVKFFNELKKVGAEFGYRSASEIMQLITKLKILDNTIPVEDCIDIAIMQKLLPKLHGSRSKLVKVLITLSSLCVKNEEFEKQFDDLFKNGFEGIEKKYPISFEKIIRMYQNVLANGFTSYAEA